MVIHASRITFHVSRPVPRLLAFSWMLSSMMSIAFIATSSSMISGGDMRRMWPAGIHASPLRNAFW